MSDDVSTNKRKTETDGGGKANTARLKSKKGRLQTTSKKISKAERKGKALVTDHAKDVGSVATDRRRRVLEKAEKRQVTPKPQIEEVLAIKQTDLEESEYSDLEYQEMMAMYDSTLQDIREGEIVKGKVLGITKEIVIVDVGFKSEGIIPIQEFQEPINLSVDDDIEVFLEAVEDQNGQLVLSKQKADFMRVWNNIKEAHDSGELVRGKLMRRIKGGIVVDLFGVDAFLPGSQIALRQVPDFDELINTELDLKIIKLNKSRRNIVVSRRVVLEQEREEKRSQLLSEIEIDQVCTGVIKNITDFGVFIDLGGVDGLLHITDMSWGRIGHPSEMVTLGNDIDVKILDFDKETGRISLGLKQLSEYPWENIEDRYNIGMHVKGKVVSLTDYGAFVELEKGIEGLIHISEMSWTQHIKHPSQIMETGSEVEAIVLSVDKDNEKISLGIKQMEPDPWTMLDEKYPIGSKVNGTVRNLTTFGAFIELEEGIDGLVHISDMSWNRRIQHPSEIMKKGQEIEVVVLKIDRNNRRISLGYKQLTDDPWPSYAVKYKEGTECVGTITRNLDRGSIVELGNEVEGFVATNQLGKADITTPAEAFNEGDELPLKVIEFSQAQRKIVLSVEEYYKGKTQDEIDQFSAKHPTTTTSQMSDAVSAAFGGLEAAKKEAAAAPAEAEETTEEPPAVPEEATTETTEEHPAATEEETDTSEDKEE